MSADRRQLTASLASATSAVQVRIAGHALTESRALAAQAARMARSNRRRKPRNRRHLNVTLTITATDSAGGTTTLPLTVKAT